MPDFVQMCSHVIQSNPKIRQAKARELDAAIKENLAWLGFDGNREDTR